MQRVASSSAACLVSAEVQPRLQSLPFILRCSFNSYFQFFTCLACVRALAFISQVELGVENIAVEPFLYWLGICSLAVFLVEAIHGRETEFSTEVLGVRFVRPTVMAFFNGKLLDVVLHFLHVLHTMLLCIFCLATTVSNA